MDYFNKRKLDFEPAIEPWKFRLKLDKKTEDLRNISKLKLSNYMK